jgi:UDP-glucuronate decarboxylase
LNTLAFGSLEFAPRIKAALREGGLRVAITGATGWLGRASLEMLEDVFGASVNARVCAFGSREQTLELRSGARIGVAPIEALEELEPEPTLLLHYAFVTKERVSGLTLEQYQALSRGILTSVTRSITKIGVRKMLFPSSGAVYGLPTRPDRSTRNDPFDNPYGSQKFQDEQSLSVACQAAGTRLFIPRLFNTSGPLINKHDAYVLSSIITAALAGGPVELRARRRVLRAYVAVEDLLNVTIGWLLEADEPAQSVVDTGGEVVEVGHLAARILRVLGRSDIQIVRPALSDEPDDLYVGDGAAFEEVARRQGISLASLDQQITDTAAYLQRRPLQGNPQAG